MILLFRHIAVKPILFDVFSIRLACHYATWQIKAIVWLRYILQVTPVSSPLSVLTPVDFLRAEENSCITSWQHIIPYKEIFFVLAVLPLQKSPLIKHTGGKIITFIPKIWIFCTVLHVCVDCSILVIVYNSVYIVYCVTCCKSFQSLLIQLIKYIEFPLVIVSI